MGDRTALAEAALDARARRAAYSAGLIARKSRRRTLGDPNCGDLSGHMVRFFRTLTEMGELGIKLRDSPRATIKKERTRKPLKSDESKMDVSHAAENNKKISSEFLLAALRVATLRAKLAATEFDTIG